MEEILELPISQTYAKHWTANDGLREILANALDTKQEISVDYDRKTETLTITNHQGHLTRKCFVLGGTDKNGKETIGQFGEGLKIGAMVLLRDGKQIIGDSGDFNFTFSMDHSKKWDSDIVSIKLNPIQFRDSTTVHICPISPSEYDMLTDTFLHFKNFRESPAISCREGQFFLNGSGELYVHGVRVSDDFFEGFNVSANLYNLTLNRDRKIFSDYFVISELNGIFSFAADEETIRTIIKLWNNREKNFEFTLYLDEGDVEKWRNVVSKLYKAIKDSDRYAVGRGELETRALYEWKHNPIFGSDSFLDFCVSQLHFPQARDVLGTVGEYDEVKMEELSEKELYIFTKAKRKAFDILKETYPMNVPDLNLLELIVYRKMLKVDDDAHIHGFFNTESKIIGINQLILNDYQKSSIVLIHEYIHAITGYEDNTRYFEDALQNCLKVAMFSEYYNKL